MTLPESKRSPGRPSDPSIARDVLDATQALLVEVGFDRLTMEAVAQRCGASKATIYRRWPSKTALVLAAAADLLTTTEVPDTGDLRGDLLACGRAYLQNDGRSIEVSASLMTASRHHFELRDAANQVLGDPHIALFRSVLRRAVHRGDVSAHLDIETIVDVFPSIACQRAVTMGLTLQDEDVIRIVDAVLMPALRCEAA